MQTRKQSWQKVSLQDSKEQCVLETAMPHKATPEFPPSLSSTRTEAEYSNDSAPPLKNHRKRSKANTPAEDRAREDERAARNRRAAQESRDRKRRLFETLDADNERLRRENQSLKDRLSVLERHAEKLEGLDNGINEPKDGDTAQAHCPAVVMSYDQQCQAASLFSLLQALLLRAPSTFRPSSLNLARSISQTTPITSFSSTLYHTPTIFPSSTPPFVVLRRRLTRPPLLKFSSKFCATLQSLNCGSPDRGAKISATFEGNRDSNSVGNKNCFVRVRLRSVYRKYLCNTIYLMENTQLIVGPLYVKVVKRL